MQCQRAQILKGEYQRIKLPDELDYSRADEFIRLAEVFSRSSNQSVNQLFQAEFPLCLAQSDVLVRTAILSVESLNFSSLCIES